MPSIFCGRSVPPFSSASSRLPGARRRLRPRPRSVPIGTSTSPGFLDSYFHNNPTFAVALGRHEFDGRLPDWSEKGLEAWKAKLHFVRNIVSTFPLAASDTARRFEREYLLSRIDQRSLLARPSRLAAPQPRVLQRQSRPERVPHAGVRASRRPDDARSRGMPRIFRVRSSRCGRISTPQCRVPTLRSRSDDSVDSPRISRTMCRRCSSRSATAGCGRVREREREGRGGAREDGRLVHGGGKTGDRRLRARARAVFRDASHDRRH